MLVAEDDAGLRSVLERGLRENGYVVDAVEDGEGALRFLAGEGMDLIVTSGGLGPTADDLTAAVVGEFQGREMVLDAPLEIQSSPNAVRIERARGRVELVDVTFGYNSAEPVLSSHQANASRQNAASYPDATSGLPRNMLLWSQLRQCGSGWP